MMSRVSYLVVLVAAMFVATLADVAKADLILDFSGDGSTSSFSVLAGGTVEVPVYLRQLSVTPPSPDITSDGLIDFGLTATLSGGTATFTAAMADAQFDFADFSAVNTPSSADLVGSANSGITGSAIQLGTFTITGTTAGSMTTLTLSDTNPGASVQDFLTESLPDNFDSDVFMPVASTTISVIPEPGSLLLAGMGLLFGSFYRNRSRHMGAHLPM